jgi:hypothetical protein
MILFWGVGFLLNGGKRHLTVVPGTYKFLPRSTPQFSHYKVEIIILSSGNNNTTQIFQIIGAPNRLLNASTLKKLRNEK